MESSDRQFGSSREDIYIGRFALIVVAIAIVAMTVIELAVALNIEFTRTLARKTMWAGSLLWMAIVIIGWVDKLKNKNESPIWCVMLFTAIATSSVAGMYVATFTTFALWANAVLSVLFLTMIVWAFPQAWKNCAPVPAES